MIVQRKKHIKILAKRFNHSIKYQEDIIKLKNEINLISIYQKSKKKIFLEYNSGKGRIKLELNDENFIDALIQIFYRISTETIEAKKGRLIDIKTYIKEEGKRAKEDIDLLKKDIVAGNPTNRQLYGNRIKAESFNGTIILMDDLDWANSNIIDFEDL